MATRAVLLPSRSDTAENIEPVFFIVRREFAGPFAGQAGSGHGGGSGIGLDIINVIRIVFFVK